MFVRSVVAVAVAAVLGAATPALARPVAKHINKAVATASPAPRFVDPARVLAGAADSGFASRTASMTSIMGPTGPVAQMQIPLRPEHPRSFRREADATASIR